MIRLTPLTREHSPQIRSWAKDKAYQEYFRRFPPFFTWDNDDVILNLFYTNSFAIYEEDSFKGLVTIGRDFPQDKQAEVGAIIDKDTEHRCALACEALKQVINYLFDYKGYRKVTSTFLTHRSGLVKAFESYGFKQEGLLRQNVFFNGEFHDEFLYSLLKEDRNWE